jgi:membrane carboxypeptidase/penicillin-binding protein
MPDDEPRRGKKPWTRRRVLKLTSIIIGFCVLAGIIVVVGAFAWVSRDLPDPNRIKDRSIAISTKIYARDGKTLLYDVHGDVKRSLVKLSDVPEHVRQATIALEDKEFYKHSGVSIRGSSAASFSIPYAAAPQAAPQLPSSSSRTPSSPRSVASLGS